VRGSWGGLLVFLVRRKTMTIERGDTLFDARPEDLEPRIDPDPELPQEAEPSEDPDPFDLGIGATVSRRNLRAMAPKTAFQRRPSRYQ
jgi:hypothetical protein